jgi:hypothetical protein
MYWSGGGYDEKQHWGLMRKWMNRFPKAIVYQQQEVVHELHSERFYLWQT